MKKLCFFVLLTLTLLNSIQAQTDVVEYLKLSELRESFMKEYLNPMAEMTSSDLNTGWFHSAKNKRFMAFDLGFSMAISYVPIDQRGYYVNRVSGFSDYYTLYSDISIAPNVAGVSDNPPVLQDNTSGDIVQLPDGNDFKEMRVPLIKLSVGLIYNTEVALRFMPKMNNGDLGKTGQFGIALKHDIKQYFSGLKKTPALSIALGVGGVWLNNDINLSYDSSSSGKQVLKGQSSSYSGIMLVGWDARIISFYAAGGYSLTTVNYDMNGNYYVGNVEDMNEVKDPVTLKYNMNQYVFYLGMAAKLGFIDLFAEYKPGNYSTFSFGLGYSFR